jgi:DNA-binding XRE family transcriptional regulator
MSLRVGMPSTGWLPLTGVLEGVRNLTEFDDLTPGLKPSQLTALDRLVAGCTDGEAAEAAGVTRQSVHNWKRNNPEFRAELNRRRGELFSTSQDRIRSLIPRALDAIERELEGGAKAPPAAMQLIRLAGFGGGQLGDIGSTDPLGVLDEERRRRADFSEVLKHLPPNPDMQEHRAAVLESMRRREREEAGGND